MTIYKLVTQMSVGQVLLRSAADISVSGRAPVAMRRALESRLPERRKITITLLRHEWPRECEWPKRSRPCKTVE
ncbi:MAG: hypothetical protein ABI980_07625 [Nitrospirota bacterium]